MPVLRRAQCSSASMLIDFGRVSSSLEMELSGVSYGVSGALSTGTCVESSRELSIADV